MYTHITHNSQKEYHISKPGEHVFYFENLSADLSFIIASESATVHIYGMYSASKKERYQLTISQIHTVPHAKSVTLIKGILRDQAHLHVNGLIRIKKEATNSHASYTNHNLLLSPQAHVISIPQLEISPHHVHCTHAVTTTPLDHAQIAYLMNRGITQADAEKLLIDAFCDDIERSLGFFHTT